MKITYTIWQGSLVKSGELIAKSTEEINTQIAELNSLKAGSTQALKFEPFIHKIEN
jgi:hypothetical protein